MRRKTISPFFLAAAGILILLLAAGATFYRTSFFDRIFRTETRVLEYDPGKFTAESAPKMVIGVIELEDAIVGASVRMLDLKNRPIPMEQEVTTNRYGAFTLRVQEIPSEFRIVATGGTHRGKAVGGNLRLESRSQIKATDVLSVNVITTVISSYSETHPALQLGVVEERVTEFLQVRSANDRTSFSGERFFEEAITNGGLDAFVRMIVLEIDRPDALVRAFPPVAQSSGAAPVLDVFGADGGIDAAGQFVNELRNAGLGTALSAPAEATGSGPAPTERSERLASLEQEVTAIRRALEDLEPDQAPDQVARYAVVGDALRAYQSYLRLAADPPIDPSRLEAFNRDLAEASGALLAKIGDELDGTSLKIHGEVSGQGSTAPVGSYEWLQGLQLVSVGLESERLRNEEQDSAADALFQLYLTEWLPAQMNKAAEAARSAQ